MYAVIVTGGKQYRVMKGETLRVELLKADVDSTFTFDQVLLVGEGDSISVGAPQENPVVLSSSDWHDIYADNVGHVSTAAGGPRGGPWRIRVENDGKYEIRLSRWPFEQNALLTAGRDEQRMTAGSLPAGKALPSKPVATMGARITAPPEVSVTYVPLWVPAPKSASVV